MGYGKKMPKKGMMKGGMAKKAKGYSSGGMAQKKAEKKAVKPTECQAGASYKG
jgi:hypothetical protein